MYSVCLLSSVRIYLQRKCEEDVGWESWIPLVESEILWMSIKSTLFHWSECMCVCVRSCSGRRGLFSKHLGCSDIHIPFFGRKGYFVCHISKIIKTELLNVSIRSRVVVGLARHLKSSKLFLGLFATLLLELWCLLHQNCYRWMDCALVLCVSSTFSCHNYNHAHTTQKVVDPTFSHTVCCLVSLLL